MKTEQTEVRMNSLETYFSSGFRAGQARRRRDESLASSLTNWFTRARRLENPEYAAAAQREFNRGYAEAMA